MLPRIDSLVEVLEETIPREMELRGIPGLAVGICDADDVLWCAEFGNSRCTARSPVDRSTIFSVQSTSKMYTATAVMLAVQRSALDLNEPITTYLPKFAVTAPLKRTRPAR